jgi:hypothetical protein
MKTYIPGSAIDLLIARSRRLADTDRRSREFQLALYAPVPGPIHELEPEATGYSAPGFSEPRRSRVNSFSMS